MIIKQLRGSNNGKGDGGLCSHPPCRWAWERSEVIKFRWIGIVYIKVHIRLVVILKMYLNNNNNNNNNTITPIHG
jgi:hypothetical protein